MDLFHPHPESEADSAHSYLVAKIRKLQRLQFYSQRAQTEEWRTLVEEVLSTPFYCSLRVLEVAGRKITPLNMGRITTVMEEYTQESAPHLKAVTALLDQILEHRELLVLEFEDAISGSLIDYSRRLQR